MPFDAAKSATKASAGPCSTLLSATTCMAELPLIFFSKTGVEVSDHCHVLLGDRSIPEAAMSALNLFLHDVQDFDGLGECGNGGVIDLLGQVRHQVQNLRHSVLSWPHIFITSLLRLVTCLGDRDHSSPCGVQLQGNSAAFLLRGTAILWCWSICWFSLWAWQTSRPCHPQLKRPQMAQVWPPSEAGKTLLDAASSFKSTSPWPCHLWLPNAKGAGPQWVHRCSWAPASAPKAGWHGTHPPGANSGWSSNVNLPLRGLPTQKSCGDIENVDLVSSGRSQNFHQPGCHGCSCWGICPVSSDLWVQVSRNKEPEFCYQGCQLLSSLVDPDNAHGSSKNLGPWDPSCFIRLEEADHLVGKPLGPFLLKGLLFLEVKKNFGSHYQCGVRLGW